MQNPAYPTRCTCQSVRENASGVSYSYELLGVLCPSCEADMLDADRREWWDSLTPAQQVHERWQTATLRVHYYEPRPNARHTIVSPF